MLTKFNDSNDMNTVASDAIHSYIKDGYRIDAKESVINREKDKDCTFKAVLKKDVDGIECKTVITLSDNGDDKNKHCVYHKVETVGDTKWSEETRTFSSSTTPNTKDHNEFKPKSWEDDSNWLENHRNRMKRISDKYGFGWDWFDSDKFFNSFKRLSDIITSPNDTLNHNDNNTDKVNSKWTCKCPSAYKRLDDYIKVNDSDDDSKQVSEQDSDNKDNHIKVESHDSVDDVYNKIVNRRKNLKDACDAKARSDKQEDNLPKQELDDDDLEDSLVKLVRYIFGK